MAQLFSPRSNALARMALAVLGLTAILLAVFLGPLQRSPWSTRQLLRPKQPVAFSHKLHVESVGLQCLYCHTTVEQSSYAGIPSTKLCMNCHSQVWASAELLEPVRKSWASGESLRWIKVNDLPDHAYFNHEIHVRKGVGCVTCHGAVQQMPVTYQTVSLQMEWCVNCHRHPQSYLRPNAEIYNMVWQEPTAQHPVWCRAGAAALVDCATIEPAESSRNVESYRGQIGERIPSYQKFASQAALGKFLADVYRLRGEEELTSCEVCHR